MGEASLYPISRICLRMVVRGGIEVHRNLVGAALMQKIEVGTAMIDVRFTRRQIGRWLNESFVGVQARVPDGFLDFLVLGVGTTAVFVGVRQLGTETSAVTVTAPVLTDVRVTDDLIRYLGMNAGEYLIGRLSLKGAGEVQHLVLEHAVLGNHMSREELLVLCSLVSTTADELEDELQRRFGGNLFSVLTPA
jgi:hypothetical protein